MILSGNFFRQLREVSMLDVLVASAYFMALDPKQARKRRPYPPLAALYAASGLRARGHSVALFDAMLQPDESAFERELHRSPARVVVLCEDSFNFLSKMCLSRMRDAALRMAEMARRSGARVMAAGPDVSDHPEPYLAAGVEYALMGESDHAVAAMVDVLLREDGDPLSIPGIVTTGVNGPVRSPARVPERRPDIFPLPAWDLVDVESYRRIWHTAHGRFSINLVSTRGCPFHCNWCAKPTWGQRYAMHSPARVAEEVTEVRRLVNPDHIWFADDIFGLRAQWVEQFADEVQRRGVQTPFTIQSRADLVTDATVNALRRAGCEAVWLGVESGSQRILDAMDKGVTVEQIRAARRRLAGAGIDACFFLQFGYPGETFEDIMATVRLVHTEQPDDIGVSVSYPLPGTVFHQRVREQLNGKTHWVDSDDLAMMFQGTYDSEFYRELHALLHRDHVNRAALRTANGNAAALMVEQQRIDEAWRLLAGRESAHRSAQPTLLPLHQSPPPPDLTSEWN